MHLTREGKPLRPIERSILFSSSTANKNELQGSRGCPDAPNPVERVRINFSVSALCNTIQSVHWLET
jgi:hypothetical protein